MNTGSAGCPTTLQSYASDPTLTGTPTQNLIITDAARFSDSTTNLKGSLASLATTMGNATSIDVDASKKVHDLLAQADANTPPAATR